MRKIQFLSILSLILWFIVRFYLRGFINEQHIYDYYFTGSYPSFAAVFGYTLYLYGFKNVTRNIYTVCIGGTLGGIAYEYVGQKLLSFGIYSNEDVIYTILGGFAAFFILKKYHPNYSNLFY